LNGAWYGSVKRFPRRLTLRKIFGQDTSSHIMSDLAHCGYQQEFHSHLNYCADFHEQLFC
jgi:hypothetical protein